MLVNRPGALREIKTVGMNLEKYRNAVRGCAAGADELSRTKNLSDKIPVITRKGRYGEVLQPCGH